MLIRNPVLKGFNPDPCIIRVDDTYYMANSTFEWFPGVRIHESKNLQDWTFVTYPLNRVSQLDMKGNPDSCGVWAPCLSYNQGIYYLIYTNTRTQTGRYKDTHNYMVTAEDIRGPWSEPIYLNSSGFDPSLFHKEDGTKWLVSMLWDYRSWKNPFGGIVMQEYSPEEKTLVGEVHTIFEGTELGLVEGPHIYKHNDYYYLMTAEGGTGYDHAVTVARSKGLLGPYEVSPNHPLITSKGYKGTLQKAGHGSLVSSKDGRWYLAYLCGRPLGKEHLCNLGRETAIEEVWWKEDWLYMASGTNHPSEQIDCESYTFSTTLTEKDIYEHFQSLRVPINDKIQYKETGILLSGGESLSSKHQQSLLGYRQQHHQFDAIINLSFDPEHYGHMAGLAYYYDTMSYYYLYVSKDEDKGRVLNLITSELGHQKFPVEEIGIESEEIFLKLSVNGLEARFSYAYKNHEYKQFGPILDAGVLSDDYYQKIYESRFTGAFIGICCQDLYNRKKEAWFKSFSYETQGEEIQQ